MVSSLTEFATMLRSEKVHPFAQTEGSLREVHDAISELLRQLANEPSVGLYFVQQHVHKAVPGMVSLKTHMMDTTLEVEYVTQDVKDALNSVKSMKEVGPAVVERMIKTLDSSQPRLASLRPSKRMSSEQVPLEKHISGQSTGDYSGYMRTTFDSAFQKASIMANVTKWNYYSKGIDLESSSSAGEQKVGLNIKFEEPTERKPSFNAQNLLGTVYSSASILRKTVSEPSPGTSTTKEEEPMAADRQEVHEFSDPLIGKNLSLPPVREIPDLGRPGEYVRSVFGSARQTAENVSREATRFLSPDGKKNISGSDKAVQGWGWLQVPSKALRVFNKQSQSSEDLVVQGSSGDTVVLKDASNSSRSEDELQQLLDIERANFEAFAADKALKLEEWLQDTEEDEKKDRNSIVNWSTITRTMGMPTWRRKVDLQGVYCLEID